MFNFNLFILATFIQESNEPSYKIDIISIRYFMISILYITNNTEIHE